MGAERDADRLAGPDPDRDPKMIDVRRDAVHFRGESDRLPREVDKVAAPEGEIAAGTRLFAWTRQRSGNGWSRSVAFAPAIIGNGAGQQFLPARKTGQAEE